MTLIATPAKPGRWVDTDEGLALTDKVLDALVSYGVIGVFCYLPLPGNDPSNDWTAALLQRVCAKGLQASPVQHVRGTKASNYLWEPGKEDGGHDARIAAGHALGCGFPPGCHIAQDLEACHGVSADSEAYTRAWGDAILGAGFKHRLYVGYSTLLSPLALYELPTPNSYWSDAGHRDVSVRGVDTSQGGVVTLGGVTFDTDRVMPDLKGDIFIACAAAPENVG